MSTILKALRRLEEDKPGKSKSTDASADSATDSASTAPDAVLDAATATGGTNEHAYETGAPGAPAVPATSARPSEARPPSRRAPTDPRATDELRERILAEERASEIARQDQSRAASLDQGEAMAAPTSASLTETLTPTPDPFANRVVEPAFTPPSNATPGSAYTGADSASSSNALADGGGLFSRGLIVAILSLGVAAVFFAGFLYSGQSTKASVDEEARVATNESARLAPSLATAPSVSTSVVGASDALTETAREGKAAPLRAGSVRSEALVASVSPPPAEVPSAPIRPMTATRAKIAPPSPPSAPREAPRQAAVSKALPAPRPAPAPSRSPALEPVEAEPTGGLARAAVTPTRAAREAVRRTTTDTTRKAPAEPVIASRPRAQTFPGERARVSAAAPPKAANPPTTAGPIQVAATVNKVPVDELPMAELAPSRAVRALPEATPRAGETRPSDNPLPAIAKSASSAPLSAEPVVELVERRGLPDLTVIRTSWHPTSDRRSAKIRLEEKNELVTLREGDSVGGMTIHEISPSAVIFSAGEVQIRRRVGEASSGR